MRATSSAAPRVVLVQKYARPNATEVTVDVDSDWAGDKRTRKSTLCVVVRHGLNVIKTQVNAMKGISLSSSEAEYAAVVKGAQQGRLGHYGERECPFGQLGRHRHVKPPWSGQPTPP